MIGKREIVIFFAILLTLNLIGICSAETLTPSSPDASPVATDDMAKIQGAVDQIPIDSSGNLNTSGFVGWKSQAELRIEAINQWLADNASWLKIVFGMVPEISWLFAISFYIFLLFIVILILNADLQIFSFLNENNAKVLGALVFVLLIAIKANFFIAKGLIWIVDDGIPFFLKGLAAGATVILVVNIITYLVCLIFFPAAATAILNYVKKHYQENRKKLGLEKEESNRKTLNALVKGMEEGRR